MRGFLKASLLIALLVLGNSALVFAGNGISVPASDHFQTKPVQLEGFNFNGKSHPAGMYSFQAAGTGKAGEAKIKVINSKGKVVAQVPGHFAGSCPGKPTKTTFSELGYSETSEVRAAKQGAATQVTIECGRGSRIEFALR